jgi:hypothetical protein
MNILWLNNTRILEFGNSNERMSRSAFGTPPVGCPMVSKRSSLRCYRTFEPTGTWRCDGIGPRMKWRGKCRHAAMRPDERMVSHQSDPKAETQRAMTLI